MWAYSTTFWKYIYGASFGQLWTKLKHNHISNLDDHFKSAKIVVHLADRYNISKKKPIKHVFINTWSKLHTKYCKKTFCRLVCFIFFRLQNSDFWKQKELILKILKNLGWNNLQNLHFPVFKDTDFAFKRCFMIQSKKLNFRWKHMVTRTLHFF